MQKEKIILKNIYQKEKIQEEHLTKDDLISSIKEKAHALTDEKDHSEEIVIDLKED